MTAVPTTPDPLVDLEAYLASEPVNPGGLPTAYEHGGRLTPEKK